MNVAIKSSAEQVLFTKVLLKYYHANIIMCPLSTIYWYKSIHRNSKWGTLSVQRDPGCLSLVYFKQSRQNVIHGYQSIPVIIAQSHLHPLVAREVTPCQN